MIVCRFVCSILCQNEKNIAQANLHSSCKCMSILIPNLRS